MSAIPQALIGAVDDWLQKQGKPPQIGAAQQPSPVPTNIHTPMVGATPQTFATPAAPRMIGAPQPNAPAQPAPATGGLIAPQPAAQPVDTYDPSKSPMIGAAPHDYAADYAAVQDPARLSPDAGKPSMLRKIGGIATGALIGALNPKAGAEIGGAIVGGPRRELERQYNADEAAAVQKRAEIEKESGLANTQSEIQDRATHPEIAAARIADLEKRADQTEAGKNTRAANAIIGRENIAKMENENKAALAAGKPQPHITTMGDDGRAHVMEYNPATKDYDIERGIAPPNYAQVAPSLKTIDILENGVPTVETLGGKQLGTSATGAPGHEMFQAGVVERAAQDLKQEIAANRDKLGDVGAIVNSAFLGTPLADPVASGLATRIASFAALNPAMHGARGAAAIQQFERIVGGIPTNPDALIASIDAISQTAGNIAPPAAAPSGGTPPKGAKVVSLDDFLKQK